MGRFDTLPRCLSPLLVLVGAVLGQACDLPPLACGDLLMQHPSERRCVCPNGGDYREGFCYLDGSVEPLEGMTWDSGEPMEPPPDAHVPDGGVDSGVDAGPDGGPQCEERAFYRDADGDGYGDRTQSTEACDTPDGYVADDSDCDDACAACHPGAAEVCDAELRDEDCDGERNEAEAGCTCVPGESIECGPAAIGQCVRGTQRCVDGQYAACEGAVGPVDEICNGLDDDCDERVDEGALRTFYRDADGDGHGNPMMSTQACTAPAGYVANNTDCNDSCASCRPGGTEVCDGLDNNCNSQVDEGVRNTYYRDADGDTYGNPAMTMQACSAPTGWVSNNTDCNDSCATCYPGAPELCDGTIDHDCNGTVDNGCVCTIGSSRACPGGTSVGECRVGTQTCNATGTQWNACAGQVGPTAETCNGRDDDCDGRTDEGVERTFYRDQDRDGFGNPTQSTSACTAPTGYVADNTDCNDGCGSCYPGATELCDGVDNNCVNGITDEPRMTFYADCDGDGFAANNPQTRTACSTPDTAPTGCASGTWTTTAPTSQSSRDCRDTDARVFPTQTEYFPSAMSGGSYDYNCDGTPEQRWLDTTNGFCPEFNGRCLSGSPGWVVGFSGGSAPACGASASYQTGCRPSGGVSGGCEGVFESRRQECR